MSRLLSDWSLTAWRCKTHGTWRVRDDTLAANLSHVYLARPQQRGNVVLGAQRHRLSLGLDSEDLQLLAPLLGRKRRKHSGDRIADRA